MSSINFNTNTFSTLIASETVYELIERYSIPDEKIDKFSHIFTRQDWKKEDLAIWDSFFRILGIDPMSVTSYGIGVYENQTLKFFSFPVLVQPEPGKIALQVGVKSDSTELIEIPLVADKKAKSIYLETNGKQSPVYFTKGEYSSILDQNVKIPYPILVIADMSDERVSDDIFNVRVSVIQKPEDKSKVEEGVEYYDHSKFERGTNTQFLDPKVLEKYIQPPKGGTYGKSPSIGMLFSEVIKTGEFTKKFPSGVMIPITGYTKINSEQYGLSIALSVDLDRAFGVGLPRESSLVGEFTTIVKEKDEKNPQGEKVENLISSIEVTGVFIGKNHKGTTQILEYENQGFKATEEQPWFLWIKEPNKTRAGNINPKHVPVHEVMRNLPPLRKVKESAPIGLLKPVDQKPIALTEQL